MKSYLLLNRLRTGSFLLCAAGMGIVLFSFTAKKTAEDFLQQLGITKVGADEKISNSLLGGYLDQYGLRNAKNIAAGNRAAVTKDLLAYAKQQINGAEFQKKYNQLRESNRPAPNTIESPEEMRNNSIAQYKKSISETEATIKKADASTKKILEPILASMKQQLKEVEDPNNKMIVNYKKNYPEMLKSLAATDGQRLAAWEAKYPANHQLFVKERLKIFMEETADIDFNAQLTEKNGRKYFANPVYEHKGNRWKLGFRAGKEVVETGRSLVQAWIDELR